MELRTGISWGELASFDAQTAADAAPGHQYGIKSSQVAPAADSFGDHFPHAHWIKYIDNVTSIQKPVAASYCSIKFDGGIVVMVSSGINRQGFLYAG